jgi:hypothetical protein
MKQILIASILTFNLFFAYGCKSHTNNLLDNNLIPIELDKINDSLSFFDIFSKVEIIPLETTNLSLLSQMNFVKVIPYEDFIYILDSKQHLIQKFDSCGKYISTINKRGRGPGEYSLLSDFGINRQNRTIELLCPTGTLYRYTLDGADFVDSFSLKDSTKSTHLFERLSDNYYVFFSIFNDKKLIYYSTKDNKIVKTDYTLPDYILKKSTLKFAMSPFVRFNDTVRFYEGHNGNIYSIDTSSLSIFAKYRWDFGKYNFNLSEVSENESDIYYYSLANTISFKYASSFLLCTESERFVISNFNFRGKIMTLAFNKILNKSHVFHRTKEGVQILSGYSHKNFHYLCVPPTYLDKFVNNSILSNSQQLVLATINIDDNYVILKYTYK